MVVGWFRFNCIFSTNRLYHATEYVYFEYACSICRLGSEK